MSVNADRADAIATNVLAQLGLPADERSMYVLDMVRELAQAVIMLAVECRTINRHPALWL